MTQTVIGEAASILRALRNVGTCILQYICVKINMHCIEVLCRRTEGLELHKDRRWVLLGSWGRKVIDTTRLVTRFIKRIGAKCI